jgi:hypothetical protein
MRSGAAFVAMLMLTIGVSACGKYGLPERSVEPQERIPVPWAAEPQPQPLEPSQAPEESQVPEERIPEPDDFDDATTGEENAP